MSTIKLIVGHFAAIDGFATFAILSVLCVKRLTFHAERAKDRKVAKKY